MPAVAGVWWKAEACEGGVLEHHQGARRPARVVRRPPGRTSLLQPKLSVR
jgi:hypothetical protein